MLHHAVGIDAETGLALGFGLETRPDVHAARIEPDEERLLVAICAVDEIGRGAKEFLVDRLHALLGERPGVLAFLLAPGAETRIVAWRVGRGRNALHDAARAELRLEGRILRIVRMLRLVLGVEVIEVAEELVEAMHGRQEFVAVAEMVLAELSGRIALRLQQLGDGRILRRQPFLGSRQANLQQPGPQRTLPGDEGGAAGGAGLLPIIVGEDRAFIGDAIDVGRAVAHHAAIVGADVPVADVIAHDDEDVGLLLLRGSGGTKPVAAATDAKRPKHARLTDVHDCFLVFAVSRVRSYSMVRS